MKMKVKIKLVGNAIMPTKATIGSAAFDLYAPDDVVIRQGRNLISTGVIIELPKGYHADVRPRSGYSLHGFCDHNLGRHDADVPIGTIDSDYRGEVGVIVVSREQSFIVAKGQRIAQLLIVKDPDVELVQTDELSTTDRGDGGFNSTGV